MNILIKTLLLGIGLSLSAALLAAGDHDHDHDDHDEEHQHEERTTVVISADIAAASGLTTAVAGAGVLHERIKLYGNIVADPLRVSHIQARYPGLIRSVKPTIGSRVKAGETLATVESNESLREYPLYAPIDGVVIERHANPGEFTADRVLFTLLDESVLELHLQAFPADAHKIKTGQTITISANSLQTHTASTKTEYITPRYGDTPTLEVHAPVDNSAGIWVPNQAVEGWVEVAQTPVALRVDNRALQQVENRVGVFVQDSHQTQGYEFHPLQLGRSDGEFTEVLEGLHTGDRYVVGNAYLLKADLEKSGAAHDH